MAIRVVHCGTGDVGKYALEGILHHPDLELIGQYAWSPEKVGVDAGALVGHADTGVTTTNDWDELLALDADCLSYFGDSIGRELEAAQTICRFLERGTNAVTVAIFPWAFPAQVPREFAEPVEAATRAGSSTAFFTGIDPGWATTDLAIAALAVADRVDCVRVTELGWWGDYSAEYVCREYFGYGQTADFEPLFLKSGFLRQMWGPTLEQIAEVLGCEIEDWNIVYETDCLDHDVQTGFGLVEAGTTSVVHFELQAISGGSPIAIVEHADRVGRGAGPQWPAPFGPKDLGYRVEIEGDPAFTLELNMDTVPGCKMTAMPAINAIPAVCAAEPGLQGPLDLPRYHARNARASTRRSSS